LVEVVTAEVRVAVGRLDFKNAVAKFKDGDIECAATEVVDGDEFVVFFVEAIGECRCGRLVDDTKDFEARDAACVLSRLTLGVVEVRRNGDNGFVDFGAEVIFSGLLHLLKNHRAEFWRRVGLVVYLDMSVAVVGSYNVVRNAGLLSFNFAMFRAHESLDREKGLFWVGDGLAFGDLAN